MHPFDYESFAAALVVAGPPDERLHVALRGKLLLCELWSEAIIATHMLRGRGLSMVPIVDGRDGFMLETRSGRVVFSLPLYGDFVKVENHSALGGEHRIPAPTELEAMKVQARSEIKAALSILF